jgi:hypothetical protein
VGNMFVRWGLNNVDDVWRCHGLSKKTDFRERIRLKLPIVGPANQHCSNLDLFTLVFLFYTTCNHHYYVVVVDHISSVRIGQLAAEV